MIKLSFCQNDPPMGESFWQKDSLITHILFELCLFRYLAQSTYFWDTLYVLSNWIGTRIFDDKVKLFWKGHITLKKSSTCFDAMYWVKIAIFFKTSGIFLQISWPSQNVLIKKNSPRHIEDKLHHDHFHACMKYVAAIVCNTEKNKCICKQLSSKSLTFTD